MNRFIHHITVENPQLFMQQALQWADAEREVVFLNNNNQQDNFHSFDSALAFDAFTLMQTDSFSAFDDLEEYYQQTKDWLFGYLSYDLKNGIEKLSSNNYDGLGFPDICFFQPKKILLQKQNQITFLYMNLCRNEVLEDIEIIKNQTVSTDSRTENAVQIQQRTPYEKYVKQVESLQSHIRLGNIYEVNYCMEFYAKQANINPLETYHQLNDISTPPFSVYMKISDNYALSASPERFLKKKGNQLISQPIKGTAKRSADREEDILLKKNLQNDPKERAENIMIVDLVRNDLSRTAEKNTVKVEELCEVYTYEQVHQMISTITSELKSNTTIKDILTTTFPMGSMTGAPKLSAMQLIEKHEDFKRGLYSGSVGYFTPDGDFDFNVIIRTILYNHKEQYLSFSVGSAITDLADADKEYQECLLKANAMKKVAGK